MRGAVTPTHEIFGEIRFERDCTEEDRTEVVCRRGAFGRSKRLESLFQAIVRAREHAGTGARDGRFPSRLRRGGLFATVGFVPRRTLQRVFQLSRAFGSSSHRRQHDMRKLNVLSSRAVEADQTEARSNLVAAAGRS
jgi:hypothetical protein